MIYFKRKNEMKEKIIDAQWESNFSDKIFLNVLFDGLVIRNSTLTNIIFEKCQFKNSYLGFNNKYIDCIFVDCIFSGKYSSFGNPKGVVAKYSHCNFKNCDFKGLSLFEGVEFHKCMFSGIFHNIILRSEKFANHGVKFVSCDLKEVNFSNISIYGVNVFKDTILPTKGIKLYSNRNDELLEKAKRIYPKVEKNYRIESEIIFSEESVSGQSVIILDDCLINTFFKTKESREVFDKIIEGFSIDTSGISENKTWSI